MKIDIDKAGYLSDEHYAECTVAAVLDQLRFEPVDNHTKLIIRTMLGQIAAGSGGKWTVGYLMAVATSLSGYDLELEEFDTIATIVAEPQVEAKKPASFHKTHHFGVEFFGLLSGTGIGKFVTDVSVGDRSLHVQIMDDTEHKAMTFVHELATLSKYGPTECSVEIRLNDDWGNATRRTNYNRLTLIAHQSTPLSFSSTEPIKFHLELSFRDWFTACA